MDNKQKFYALQTGQCLLTLVLISAIIGVCNDRQDARFPTRTIQTQTILAGAAAK